MLGGGRSPGHEQHLKHHIPHSEANDAPQSRVELPEPPPLLLLKFWLPWFYKGVCIYTVTSAMNSCPCQIQSKLFHCRCLWLLGAFCPLFWNDPWAWAGVGKGWRCYIDIPFKAKHSNLIYVSAWWLVMSLCINHHVLQEEASLMRVESCTNLWV